MSEKQERDRTQPLIQSGEAERACAWMAVCSARKGRDDAAIEFETGAVRYSLLRRKAGDR